MGAEYRGAVPSRERGPTGRAAFCDGSFRSPGRVTTRRIGDPGRGSCCLLRRAGLFRAGVDWIDSKVAQGTARTAAHAPIHRRDGSEPNRDCVLASNASRAISTWCSSLCGHGASAAHAEGMDEENAPLPDSAHPINLAHSLQATVVRLTQGYREHEYWSEELVPGQMLRSCAEVVNRIGTLAGRITAGDPEIAEASRWLAELLAWHGRRAHDADRARPGRPTSADS